jgi:hypothetical protein
MASFEVFVTESQTRLFGSLCLMTGSRYEAEEIAQEAYTRVLERWDHVQRLDDPTGAANSGTVSTKLGAALDLGSIEPDVDVVERRGGPDKSRGDPRGARHRRGPTADPSGTIGRPNGGVQIPR